MTQESIRYYTINTSEVSTDAPKDVDSSVAISDYDSISIYSNNMLVGLEYYTVFRQVAFSITKKDDGEILIVFEGTRKS